MILHELSFESLGGEGISGGALEEALACDIGSVDRWGAEFVATGKALGGVGLHLARAEHQVVVQSVEGQRL